MRKIKKNSVIIILLLLFGAYAFIQLKQLTIFSSQKVVQENDVTYEFIQIIGNHAKRIAKEHDLYASVMIAQAILESQSGQSRLSTEYYNLFGIKGDYGGASVALETWEDDGMGNSYTITADFRAYPSWVASLEDYANLLSTDVYINAQKTNAPTYADATAALTGLYATDTAYANKLNCLIETYQLTTYDE